MSEFKKYRPKQIAELRHFVPGEILDARVSISKADRDNGSPIGKHVRTQPGESR